MANEFDPYYKWLGIPPKDQPPHHYRLLGIEVFETDREVIDAAANRLMGYLKDLAVGDEGAHSQQLLNEISRARLCLLKKKTKAAYDEDLRNRLKAEEALERESRKPTAKGPPPKVSKRSVPPPAVPPSGAMPPAAVGPPAAPKAPGKPAARFDPVKISPPQDSPEKSPDTDPVKIVVNVDEPKKPAGMIEIAEVKKPAGVKKPRKPAKKAVEAKKSPAPKKKPSEAKAAPEVKEQELAVPTDLPTPHHSTGRGLLFAWVLIAAVGLIGLALIIVMSVLLMTS